MTTFPTIRQVVLDTTDARGLAEFYRALFGLEYRAGDEPPATGRPDPAGTDSLLDEWIDVGALNREVLAAVGRPATRRGSTSWSASVSGCVEGWPSTRTLVAVASPRERSTTSAATRATRTSWLTGSTRTRSGCHGARATKDRPPTEPRGTDPGRPTGGRPCGRAQRLPGVTRPRARWGRRRAREP